MPKAIFDLQLIGMFGDSAHVEFAHMLAIVRMDMRYPEIRLSLNLPGGISEDTLGVRAAVSDRERLGW